MTSPSLVQGEREAFEAHLKRMPTWAPEFEIHRGWVEMFAWDVWQASASRSTVQQVGTEWQPIETAPSDVMVLLFTPELHCTNPQRIEARVYHDTRAGSRHAWATHWMPLPAAPTSDGGMGS